MGLRPRMGEWDQSLTFIRSNGTLDCAGKRRVGVQGRGGGVGCERGTAIRFFDASMGGVRGSASRHVTAVNPRSLYRICRQSVKKPQPKFVARLPDGWTFKTRIPGLIQVAAEEDRPFGKFILFTPQQAAHLGIELAIMDRAPKVLTRG